MGSAAWDSCSHSAVLITSQLPPLSLRKRGEGSSAGSSQAPTHHRPRGERYGVHFTRGGGNSPSYRLQNTHLAVEFEGLDLGADVSGWWCWSYPPGEQQAMDPAWWEDHVCLLGGWQHSAVVVWESDTLCRGCLQWEASLHVLFTSSSWSGRLKNLWECMKRVYVY